ncbi:MAG: MacB family efflux pump subunit [Gammaproteobacteria bacterium]|nr:MacB family efflux pump subunit [Gammaproteobacteria bacterium]
MASTAEIIYSADPGGIAAVPLIELRNLSRTFVTGGGVAVHALSDISLKIYPGEFVSIMGQSGSGKSTLMNILGCLDRPTSGDYLFSGRDIRSFDADGLAWLRRKAFGFVFQSYNLLGTATAWENVEVPAIYAGLPQAERSARAAALLASLGLGDRMDHRPNQLSGGQQQRVSIARALMNGGDVILADEPTGALDSQSGVEVMALLKDLSAKGHTVIIITHEPDIAAQTDRQIELLDGMIVKDTRVRQAGEMRDAATSLIARSGEMSAAGTVADMREAVRMAFRSLRANAFRTSLTLLGIVIGVASVVAMLAIGEGAQRDIIERISSMGVNMLSIRSFYGRSSDAAQLTIEDIDAISLEVPNVQATLPEISGNAVLRYGNRDYESSIIATSSNLPETRNWLLSRGVFFTDEDSDTYTPVAVLGATIYEELFEPGQDPLGEYILIQNVPFLVIGTMTRKGSSGFGGRDQDEVVFLPLKTGGLRLFGRQYLRSLTVAVEDPALIHETEAALSTLLITRHGQQDFRIFNSAELLENVSESQQTFTILLGSVAAISLLVGGIGVMNIMLVSVTERTREIGIRMATGARQSDILLQFLSEAIVVSALGGLLGILIGVAVAKLIQTLGTSAVVSATPMILAFSCAAATGLIFGYAPAKKAAGLDPVEALASE